MTDLRRAPWPLLLLLLCLAGPLAAQPAWAQDRTKADELAERGDYLFKSGYYFRASDSYRLALLEDPTSPWKKLSFAHSLFAVGQYGYASYALRRAVAELDPKKTFQPEVAPLFPSRRRFQQALRDLKRYVTYSPRDAAGLTVLGYVLYSVTGEERRCRDMFNYLLKLNPDDAFAQFFLDQLDRRARQAKDPAAKEGEPAQLLLKGYDEEVPERVHEALRVHPGVKALTFVESGVFPKLRFRYVGKSLEGNLKNLLASLSITAELREVPTAPGNELRSFIAEAPAEEEPVVEAPGPAPAEESEPETKTPLKDKVPAPERARERLENEWPAPKPAKAR